MSYWSERQEAMYKSGEMQVNQYYAKLEKAFNQTKRELQKTIESFYFRYAEENGLSYAAAQKHLNAAEIGELKDFIDLSMQNIGRHNQTVNNMSIKARITRYQALEAQVDATLRQLYAVDYQAGAEQTMKAVYGDTYYQTWYHIDQMHGFHSAFAQVDPLTVEKLLEYPFNGANFSSRLWKQKDHLQTQLMESLTTIMVQGKNPQVLTKDFAKKMTSKKFDAYRLLQTESSFLMSEAAHAAYKEDGVEKYQILAALDSKTCGICGDLDGEIFDIDKAIVSVNMPPFHCFCRCTDVPCYDDTDVSDETRVARDPETGKTYEVSGDMTYNEWKGKFLENGVQKGKETADYLVRSHTPDENTTAERLIVNEAVEAVPQKVQQKIHAGTIIDVGQIGASQYDYTHDILYVAKGAETTDIIHEIGHLVENKMLDSSKVEVLKRRILENVSPLDFVNETYYNAAGEPVEIFLIKSEQFVSEYQGRVYINEWSELLDDDMRVKPELVAEFVSEPFREYVENPERLQHEFPEFYELIKGEAE
ncbi:MAG: minor capsid protein [Hungatella sp.]